MSATTANPAEFQDGGKPVAVAVYQVDQNGNPITSPMPVQYVSQAGYIPLTSPPATTTASVETIFTFGSTVNTVILQNNTPANANFAFDTTVTAGSLVLAPGQYIEKPKKITAVHLLTAAAQNVNGTGAGNIVLLGEL